jgi:hypothetical protein
MHCARCTAVLLTALALCLTALSQEQPGAIYPPGDSNSPNGNAQLRFSLGGTVVNSVTSEPVIRSLVSVSNGQYAMTDNSGRFRFDGIPAGQVSVSAEKPGFFNPAQTESLEPRVRVNLTANVGDVVLKLMPQAVVAGRITSIDGGPLEDFPVRLYARKIVDGRAQWQSTGQSQTDEDGQFRIANLRPGQYCLSAGPEHRRLIAPSGEGAAMPGRNNGQSGYPQAFYADASDLASATQIDLFPGQQFEADFSLKKEPLYEISGQVVGAPPGDSVGWTLLNSSGEPLNSLRFRPERQQFFGYVPAGRYTLHFFARHESQQLSANVPVTVAGNTVGIQAVLAPETAIPVNIRVESNTPRPVHSMLQAVVRLRPYSVGLEQTEYASTPAQQGNGPNYIVGAPPGTYSVEVQALGAMYVQSATSGSIDLLSEPLAIPSGSKVEPIDLTLRDDGGRVSGNVQGQGPGTVLLVPERGARSDIKSMEFSGGGSFSFDQVRPGDYFVVAVRQASDLEYKNPDVLAPYLSRAAHVTVSPRQEVNVNLELIESK